jgi:SAM-dependent methyltransferase
VGRQTPAYNANMVNKLDPYAEIAELYDLEHLPYDEDVEFYGSFIEAAGDPVLELACGSGRLLLPIARAGYRVTGLDRSESMLDRAESLLKKQGLFAKVTLHQASMEDATSAPGGPFGVAIVALNSLMHLTSQSEQRACLQSVLAALDPRGQLLVDILNPTPETLRGFDHALTHDGVWHRPDGVRVDKFSSRRVYPATQQIETELWYDLTGQDGSVKRVATSYTMRYLYRSELELMLELAGFSEWQIYGSYDLDSFTDHSERLIVAAEVTSSR